ncbi:hypothetical protein N2152v2_007999 [Parachlorella kessleri]
MGFDWRFLSRHAGDSERKVKKGAEATGADCVCLDLEDAVAHSRKPAARDTVATALATLDFGRSERAVRINGVATSYIEEDLQAVLTGKQLPDALVVPKIDDVDQVSWLASQVDTLAGERLRREGLALTIISMCESGMGLLNLKDIFQAFLAAQERAPLRLEACIFGADDFCASLGMKRQPGTDDTALARRWVALHARSFGLQPIDQVFIDFKNQHGFTVECEEGRRLGFTGKQVIHPTQVLPAQAAFSPDPHDVEEAKQLVKAFDKHQQAGKAKNLLLFAERIDAV